MILSIVIVINNSWNFTGDYFDKKTGKNIIDLIKDFSKININSINDIISTHLLKIQLSLSELIIYYQNVANKLKTNNKELYRIINEDFLKCVLDLNESINKKDENAANIAFWFLDDKTNLANLKENSTEQNQLIAISNMIQNFYSTYYASNSSSKNIYLYFESTELFINFPLLYAIENGFIFEIANKTNNQVWCTDENGEIYTTYKVKCRPFYLNIKKAKSDVFDINFKDNENRTIFVTEIYTQQGDIFEIIFSMCIEFNDPLSNKLAYICSDINSDNLNYNLDNINSKLSGYFFINSIGCSQAFYFPGNLDEALTNTESIYRRDIKFFLKEKIYFSDNIQRLLSSNYIKQINKSTNSSLISEVYTNGENGNNQIFYINNEEFHFSIYPIILENYKGNKEHILNIIFVYNNKMFYDDIKIDLGKKYLIIIEIIIFFIIGFGLLYLISLSINSLSIYIVIPVRNVNYMLKGINIGGKNRLKYLYLLKKRQDENAEQLEKMNDNEYKKDKNEKESNSNLKDENNENGWIDETKNKNNEILEESPLIENDENIEENNTKIFNDNLYNNEVVNSKKDCYKKFEDENELIESESTFFDFDEQLLRYRPLEIQSLVKALIDIKDALLLTSCDQQVEGIIKYSNSEEIFRSFKNKEGKTICESNIGNLQSQLLKYDKAIFHLAISLEDNKLKKFLSKGLSDEFDENDTLLNTIYTSFTLNKNKEKKNKIVEKQENNSKNHFSQKIIGILSNNY